MVPAPPRVVSPHRSEALPERSVSWLTLGCAGGRFRLNRAPDRESGDGAERDAFGHRGPFVAVSPLEGDGFEPSAFYPESNVSAASRASVAAILHPYSAQICTPVSTQSCNPNLSTWDCLRRFDPWAFSPRDKTRPRRFCAPSNPEG